MFTSEDVRHQEDRTGLFYFVTRDGKQMMPATHIGADRAAIVSPSGFAPYALVNWRVVDFNGKTIVHSTERNYSGDRLGAYRALRRAVESVRNYGCETRVRPGDAGPW